MRKAAASAAPFLENNEIKATKELKVKLDKKTKAKKLKRSEELEDYVSKLDVFKLNGSNSVSKTWSKHICIRRPPIHSLYLANSSAIQNLLAILKKELIDPNGTLVEINAGFGVLTSFLVKELSCKYVNVFEEDENLGKNLVNDLGVNLLNVNFHSLPRLHHADKIDGGGRISKILENLKRGTSDKTVFIGATGSSSCISFLIRSLVTQKVFFEDDAKLCFYLGIPSKTYMTISSSPKSKYTLYRPSSIIFQLLFKWELLCLVPRSAFLPWETSTSPQNEIENPHTSSQLPKIEKSSNYRKVRIVSDTSHLYFIKLSPNEEFLKELGKDNLVSLLYFIRHNLYSRHNSVIKELESWIPGCGKNLIKENGLSIFTEFGSLEPQQIYSIYSQFISSPSYSSSSFCAAVEKYGLKIESADEEALDLSKNI